MATNENIQTEKHALDVMGHKGLWFGVSIAILIPCIIAIAICFQRFGAPVKLGIDFTGGTLMEVTFDQPEKIEAVRGVFEKQAIEPHITAATDEKTFSIRTPYLDKDKSLSLKEDLRKVGSFNEPHFRLESVGPTIGKELLRNAAMALGFGILGILLYITFRYQFDFALSAIIAMVHDGVIMLGTFAIFSLVLGAEADGLLVVAILTIMGFSVHDTIVIFDRFRENLKFAKKGDTFGQIANASVNQTLARSINTSLTLVLTLLPLVILGGHTIFFFTLTMLIGVVIGAYSSIFNAGPILVLLRERGNKPNGAQTAAKTTA
ncbi:MAG TPA: protein translocase subunit SecF [Pantanalinema sp.]